MGLALQKVAELQANMLKAIDLIRLADTQPNNLNPMRPKALFSVSEADGVDKDHPMTRPRSLMLQVLRLTLSPACYFHPVATEP